MATDGTLQIYAHSDREATFWYSPDGGLSWQQRTAPEPVQSLAVYSADARALYMAGQNIFFSADTGLTWEHRGRALGSDDPVGASQITLHTLPSQTAPVDLLVKEISYGFSGSQVRAYTMYLSTNGGRSFQEVAPQVRSQLIYPPEIGYTADGSILRYQEEFHVGVEAQLARSTDDGQTWVPQLLPPDYVQPPVLSHGPKLVVVPSAPANVFLWSWGRVHYSADNGHTWQTLTTYSDDRHISPYLPLEVLSTQNAGLATQLLVTATRSVAAPVGATHAPGSTYFSLTSHNLGGPFQAYWAQYGDLAQHGYPLTEPLLQADPGDGQVYVTQYFERAVFEYHPENAPPHDVLLRLLGVDAYRQRYGPAGAPQQQASTDHPRFFPETGHTVGGLFRTYWESHGGLAQQGYPLSEEFVEVSPDDGQRYTVQYFERAVFEHHPEYAGTAYEVLLRPLGTAQLQQWAIEPYFP